MLSSNVTSPKSIIRILARHRNITSGAKYDAKMRSLVALYHQTDAYITPENLDHTIDQAFVYKHTDGGRADYRYADLESLRQVATLHRSSIKNFFGKDMGTMDAGMMGVMGPGWTDDMETRRERVLEALTGTQTDRKPSWDVLKENVARVEKELEEDHANARQNGGQETS